MAVLALPLSILQQLRNTQKQITKYTNSKHYQEDGTTGLFQYYTVPIEKYKYTKKNTKNTQIHKHKSTISKWQMALPQKI